MFKAISTGKAGRLWTIYGTESKDAFTIEDILTSCVFERMQYLSAETFAKVISNRIKLPADAVLSDIEYWPKWNSKGRQYVEPDVFIQFKCDYRIIGHLIVEAKRYDGNNSQSTTQWTEQLKGYFDEDNELALSGGEVYFLAIGGNIRARNFEYPDRRFDPRNLIQLDWSRLAGNALKLGYMAKKRHEKIILLDIVDILERFGFRVPNYLDELNVPQNAHWTEGFNG